MNRKLNGYLSLLLLLASISHCGAQSLDRQFARALDSIYKANKEAVGILIDVRSKKHQISWTAAAGYADKETKNILLLDQPALIASNTKTYVSAAILKLVEADQLDLQGPIENILALDTKTLLINAGYNLKEITVEHLLSHTSGIKDYVDSLYFKFVDEHPDHQWTRGQQIALSAKKGAPIASPSEKFFYGDINYLLLTEIIERKTDQPFHVAIRELLDYEGNGLNSTWFTQLEDPPPGKRPIVHQYWSRQAWDSYNINPSWDLYGGGGIVATVSDLGLFFQKLFNHEIVKDTALLAQMYDYVIPQEQSNYCLGLRKIMFYGSTGFYHGGFWGTDAMYLPEYDLTIAVFTLEKDKRNINPTLSAEIINLLKQAIGKD